MAFEGLYTYTDKLVEQYKRADNMNSASKMTLILEMLVDYYNTALKPVKFKDQKKYCFEKIWELNPAFAEGYFGKRN